jgi:hypothetical protein
MGRVVGGVAAGLLLLVLALLGVERGLDVGLVTRNPALRNATFGDFDELWHLETGRVIVETGRVPERDPFTYTAGETPWTNTNWLAQVLLWELYRAGGIELDWTLGIALWLGAVVLVDLRARRRAPGLAALLGTLYVLLVLRRTSEVRPQGWTFLLLAAALLLADLLRPDLQRDIPLKVGVGGGLGPDPQRDIPLKVGIGALALVLVLADQLHGGFVFLHVALLLAAVGVAIDARSARAARPLALALAAGLLGFVLHPHHASALVHPLRYALEPGIRFMASRTEELEPPRLNVLQTGADVIMAALIFTPTAIVALGALIDRKRFSASDALQVGAFLLLAVGSRRGLHYFAIVVAGPLAIAFSVLLEKIPGVGAFDAGAREGARFTPLALALAVLVTLGGRAHAFAPGAAGDMPDRLFSAHPDVADMASFVSAVPGSRILNSDTAGGALLWKCWPGKKVFIDTRGDFHGLTGAFADLVTVWNTRSGWEAIVERDRCDLALVEHISPLEVELRARGWKVLRVNATFTLLARPSKNE